MRTPKLAPNPDRSLHIKLWLGVAAVFVWSYVGCYDRFTWVMEVSPVVIGTIILVRIYPHWRFTRLVCWLLFIHSIVLIIGGHYTYARVPSFNWLKDTFHLDRNYYDRLGHFLQGFVPAMISREILLRNGVLKRGGWLNFIVICICLAFSACYEFVEWQAAVWSGEKADSFLGTQGDPWDTQWDMAMALIGAITALLTVSRRHDRELERV